MILKNLIFLVLITKLNAMFYNDTIYISNLKNDVYLRNFYIPLFNQTIDYLKFLSQNDEINLQCRLSLSRWTDGIQNKEFWALKFLESTGKQVNGKLTGNTVNYGSFDYCVRFSRDTRQGIDFDGKYCLVSLQTRETQEIKTLDNYKRYQATLSDRSKRLLDFNLGSAHGLCMPSTCRIEEIATVFNKTFQSFGFSLLPPRRCTTKSEGEPWTSSQIISISILLIFFSLCLLSQFVQNDFLSNFSFTKNLNTIYLLTESNTDEQKLFLHGMKFLMVITSIFMHVFIVLSVFYVQPFATAKEYKLPDLARLHWSRVAIFGDSLFFLGGFFAMYSWYDVVKSGKMKYNFYNFFITRYVKLAIALIVSILSLLILPQLGVGPYFSDLTTHISKNCEISFWRTFLLISNEQRTMDMCVIPAWYFSADTQIYLLNYFVIFYMIVKHPLGFLLGICQMIAVSVFTLIYVQRNNLPPFYNLFDFLIYDLSLVEDSYFPTFFHYNNYVIGLKCAWLVKSETKPKILRFRVVRWSISAIVFPAYLLMSIYLEYLESNEMKMNEYLAFFWPIIDRLFAVLTPFWIFYSCCIGYSKAFRKLMSFQFFIPWSRLSFTLIACQFTFLFFSVGITVRNFSYNWVSFVKESAIIFIFLLGNILFMVIEGPLFNLFRTYAGFKRRMELGTKKIDDENFKKQLP